MRLPRLILLLPFLLGIDAPALAAPGDSIGSAVTVVNLVTAKLEDDQRELATGDDVRQQELIEVSTDGRSELMLRDKTKLALGPGSRLLLDQFVYNPDISGGAIVLDLVRGTFRFITGVAAKPAYVIRTPTASITVRGTIFDVYVQLSGMTWLLLIEGAIEVCTEDGKCQLHDEPGKLIRVTSGKVDKPVKWASLNKEDVPFDTAFPFVGSAPGVDPDPIFTRDDIVLGTFPDKPGSGDDGAEPSDNDGGRKADESKDKKKKKAKTTTKKKSKAATRKRRKKSDSAGNIIKGLNITIGVGGGFGGGGKKHRGGGDNYGPR